ncbi:MAG: aconitate hydratase AcnA [Desulfocapsaceae bacterium]|nr:aconitate hydratase AcnA [Desulfocapsaceae bacterium]
MERNEFISHMQSAGKGYHYYDIQGLEKKGLCSVRRLPFSVRILVENLLRKLDHEMVKEEDVRAIANWQKSYQTPVEIPYHPARVLMQDFTGIPAVVDLAAMRDAVKALGGDPARINPLVPVELVVDHSVQIDAYGSRDCLHQNVAKEYERNNERYTLLKWAQKSFNNFMVVPPNSGICHQVNLEYLGRVVIADQTPTGLLAYPDTLVGLDSHTTMINGIGVLGWGVGGIEAEAVMLGQPYYMSIPAVVGVRLTGSLRPGITATDLVLTITQMLRRHKVVEKFVEYFGPGLKNLSIPYRATISNMTPEYGATAGFFPVDEKTLEYLRLTNRSAQAVLTEAYTKAAGLFSTGDTEPEYSEVIDFDLATVEPSLAGPSRPQDRISLTGMREAFTNIMGCAYDHDTGIKHASLFHEESGCDPVKPPQCVPAQPKQTKLTLDETSVPLSDGSVVIAAITSCTNTSNPHVLIGAGLVARRAVEKGLRVPPHVKTSLAPGSKVVLDYLNNAGLMDSLEALGFHLAAFGCTTCIGNSGPLHPEIERAIQENNLNVAAVLSGNRNFEARIHQSIKSNFLASPMLVVAFALAGRIDIDLTTEPLGTGSNGASVYLRDLWPTDAEIDDLVQSSVKTEAFSYEYGRICDGDVFWDRLPIAESITYDWKPDSTYIKKPPYFDTFDLTLKPIQDIINARPFLLLGDSVTTDHISPAGSIPAAYPAGQYLRSLGVPAEQFNSYGSRRGNHEVMMRGTFSNIRIKNHMAGLNEGGYTFKYPEKKEMYNYDSAMAYKRDNIPLIVLGGKEYGTGSSRDWAAKGTSLLGIKAVLVESFERIHRNNLVGMGVLPLIFSAGENADSLGFDGSETFHIENLADLQPRQHIPIRVVKADGAEMTFTAVCRLDTEIEIAYFKNGGILPYVLRQLIKS